MLKCWLQESSHCSIVPRISATSVLTPTEICSLPLPPQWANQDCLIFLWQSLVPLESGLSQRLHSAASGQDQGQAGPRVALDLCCQTSSSGCRIVYIPRSKLQLPITSPRASLTLADSTGPGSYLITAFALGPGACKIFVCTVQEWRFFPPSPPVELLQLSPADLQHALGFHSPGDGLPGWGTWHEAHNSFLWENLCNIVVLIVAHSPGGMRFDYIVNLPLLPISLWFFCL